MSEIYIQRDKLRTWWDRERTGRKRGSSAASVARQAEFERRWLARQDAPMWPLDQLVLNQLVLVDVEEAPSITKSQVVRL